MTTTAFQWVFDNAESINFNRRSTTAQTISRSNVVRTVSRGGQAWRFEVKLPDGPRWSNIRSYIEAIDYADRYTVGTVKLNNPGYSSWLSAYQGDATSITGFNATWIQGNNSITLTSSPSTPSGYKFRAGDIIQLEGGHVYTVSADVAFTGTTVPLNRPVIDASGSGALYVATMATWNLICVEMPQWTIFQRDQVSWSGPFVFYEAML